jgi:hypothetical protein
MAAVERALRPPAPSRAGMTDGRARLRLCLAIAGLAGLAISGLFGAHDDFRTGVHGSRQAISTGEDGYGRWASPGPGWRSRSQILEDAGILNRRGGGAAGKAPGAGPLSCGRRRFTLGRAAPAAWRLPGSR